MPTAPYSQALATLMQNANIADLAQLADVSGLSSWQLARIQYGLLSKMPVEVLLKLAIALNLSLEELVTALGPIPIAARPQTTNTDQQLALLQQEYQRLQQQLQDQENSLQRRFQQEVVASLEPWLLQWPTAAAVAQKNPQWPALKLLPLVRPIANLLQQWQVEAIAAVGEIVTYDPQWHQPLDYQDDEIASGTAVVVRYVGYRRGDTLLYRAKVSINLKPDA